MRRGVNMMEGAVGLVVLGGVDGGGGSGGEMG